MIVMDRNLNNVDVAGSQLRGILESYDKPAVIINK